MKPRIFYFAFICIAICSCKEATKSQEKQSSETPSQSFKDEHTSRNSLDWAGVYTGILPCADCEGIQTEIELNSDFIYQKTTNYLGKSQEPIATEGKFNWDETGNEIKLQNEGNPNSYKVVENALIALDMEGNVIDGNLKSNYRLEKTNSELMEQ